MTSIDVSIVIPTQRRPDGLRTAARSVFRQVGVGQASLELIVCDNDRESSAREPVEALAGCAPMPVVYVHEPRPGVASARNAALTVARGELIAFLDDDEEASEGWLAALLDARERYGADVVFGPVRGRAPGAAAYLRPYLERFFSREGPTEAGPIDHYYGCGDSLVRRSALPDPHTPFREVRNHTGGEDDLLFGAMKRAGARFAWAPNAWVWEDPVPERLRLAYTIRRAFAYGQGPTSACAIADPPNRWGVAGWMLVGLVQTGVYGPIALVKWAARRRDRAEALDRAARSLGKLLWGGPFKIRFYGRSS